MALQGNLKDFSLTEILQLLGTQKKTGCLVLDRSGASAVFYVLDGRIVATRRPGLAADDPLLHFLLKIHRVSDEQERGLRTLQSQSKRDLEDLLVSGRYTDSEELSVFIERQILNDLMVVARWNEGTYMFDANQRWPNPPLVRLSVEGALMETARRADEYRRLIELFHDKHQLIGVRDLPDPDQQLSEDESELFGLIDGRHTLAEIIEAAPLTEFEAFEVLQRMLELNWIEVVGRRDPGAPPPPLAPAASVRARPATPLRRVSGAQALACEIGIAVLTIAVAAGLVFGARALHSGRVTTSARDEFAASRMRDVRLALELYKREHGRYPEGLGALVEERWMARERLSVSGRALRYRLEAEGQAYDLQL